MIDTHCHLEKDDYENIPDIIDKCIQEGVEKLIVSGHDVKSCREVMELISKYPNVYGTVGFLPEVVDEITDDDLTYLESILSNDKIVGVGEIGLDYHFVKDNKDKQKELFIKQLDLAKKYDLPVVIHCRDAILDTYNILKEEKINKGTMHCYSGSLEFAYNFIELGLYLSIGGVSTFKNAKEIKRVVSSIPLKHLLLETDCPYLTPEPYRGKKNYPYYIPLIARNISELKGEDYERVCSITTENACALFDI